MHNTTDPVTHQRLNRLRNKKPRGGRRRSSPIRIKSLGNTESIRGLGCSICARHMIKAVTRRHSTRVEFAAQIRELEGYTTE